MFRYLLFVALFLNTSCKQDESQLGTTETTTIDSLSLDDFWLDKVTTYGTYDSLNGERHEQQFFYKGQQLDSIETINYWQKDGAWSYFSRTTEKIIYNGSRIIESQLDHYDTQRRDQCDTLWENSLCKLYSSLVKYAYEDSSSLPTQAKLYSTIYDGSFEHKKTHYFTWNSAGQLIEDSVVTPGYSMALVYQIEYDSLGNVKHFFDPTRGVNIPPQYNLHYFNPYSRTRDQRIISGSYYNNTPRVISPNLAKLPWEEQPEYISNKVGLPLKKVLNGKDSIAYTYSKVE